MTGHHRRSIGVLIVSNLLGGIGVASGFAVGGLLAQSLGGTSMAGFAQACSTLGAAIAAIPLANLAARRGRRVSLTLGYIMATIGALTIVGAAVLGNVIVLLAGMGLFGIAQAVNLQSRYAGAESVSPATRARAMSIVLWATTVGSVAGPNLSAPGDRLGAAWGLPSFVGPYLFSVLAFASAATVITVLFRPSPIADDQARAAENGPALAPVGAVMALRWAAGQPRVLFAIVLIAVAHAVMVMVMVMTPVHMQGTGETLELVGIVISVHILGMYALSPLFGWAVDRFGALAVSASGLLLLGGALAMGFVAAAGGVGLTMAALALLGLGWSAAIISGSALVTAASPSHVRVALQGVTDAAMNYAGAASAASAGAILAFGGFEALNLTASLILLPAILLLVRAVRSIRRNTAASHR